MQEVPNKHQHVSFCELCSGDHPRGYCPSVNENVNYMGNQNQYKQRQAPYQGHPGYQRGNDAYCGQGWRAEAGPSNRKNPYQNYNQNPQPQDRTSKMEDTLTQFMKMSMEDQKSTDAAIKNLEIQVHQIAKLLAHQQKGTFFCKYSR